MAVIEAERNARIDKTEKLRAMETRKSGSGPHERPAAQIKNPLTLLGSAGSVTTA